MKQVGQHLSALPPHLCSRWRLPLLPCSSPLQPQLSGGAKEWKNRTPSPSNSGKNGKGGRCWTKPCYLTVGCI